MKNDIFSRSTFKNSSIGCIISISYYDELINISEIIIQVTIVHRTKSSFNCFIGKWSSRYLLSYSYFSYCNELLNINSFQIIRKRGDQFNEVPVCESKRCCLGHTSRPTISTTISSRYSINVNTLISKENVIIHMS